jgi:hypothetical protein
VYKGHDLASTHYVPSMTQHPLTGDLYVLIQLFLDISCFDLLFEVLSGS